MSPSGSHKETRDESGSNRIEVVSVPPPKGAGLKDGPEAQVEGGSADPAPPPSSSSEREDNGVKQAPPPNLTTRLALRPVEAAAALGICERTLRGMLPELPHMRIGDAVLLPVKPLENWLAERAKAEASRVDQVAREIIDALDDFE
jgi:hypothetical protein